MKTQEIEKNFKNIINEFQRQYKIKFNSYQKNIFNNIDCNGNKRHYLMSVMSYLIKYSENGLVIKSLNRLFAMYIRYHKKVNSTVDSISKAYFFKLVNELVELELLSKENRKVFILGMSVDKKVEEKVEKVEEVQTVENTELEEDLQNPKYKGLNNYSNYTNTNIVDMLVKFYRGISDRKTATKKDMINIAKSLFVLDRINEQSVQASVFAKINNSKQQIHLNGVVQYVRCVIMDKLAEFDSVNFTSSTVDDELDLAFSF